MSFGDTLRELSGNTVFEKMVWEKMKLELVHIASDRHANGCHVKFIGFGSSFINEITEVILSDGITDFCYYDDAKWPYGVIYWGRSNCATKCCISDSYLEVTLTSDERIFVERVQLTEDKKHRGYTYIS